MGYGTAAFIADGSNEKDSWIGVVPCYGDKQFHDVYQSEVTGLLAMVSTLLIIYMQTSRHPKWYHPYWIWQWHSTCYTVELPSLNKGRFLGDCLEISSIHGVAIKQRLKETLWVRKWSWWIWMYVSADFGALWCQSFADAAVVEDFENFDLEAGEGPGVTSPEEEDADGRGNIEKAVDMEG